MSLFVDFISKYPRREKTSNLIQLMNEAKKAKVNGRLTLGGNGQIGQYKTKKFYEVCLGITPRTIKNQNMHEV